VEGKVDVNTPNKFDMADHSGLLFWCNHETTSFRILSSCCAWRRSSLVVPSNQLVAIALNIEQEFDMVMLMGCQDDHVQIASTVTKWKEKLM
jgi:hypothetical protein